LVLLKVGYRLTVFENSILRRIFGEGEYQEAGEKFIIGSFTPYIPH
jgi:hypothetical protein